MADSRKRRGEKRDSEGDSGGSNRPTRFDEHKGYVRSRRKLDPTIGAKFVAQVEKFKQEWRNCDFSLDDLKATWGLKFLKGEAKKLGVRQITLTIPYRVAFVVDKSREKCVLLHLYKRSMGKNDKDYETATERARQVDRRRR